VPLEKAVYEAGLFGNQNTVAQSSPSVPFYARSGCNDSSIAAMLPSMGIDVNGKQVSYAAGHNRRVYTDVGRNPTSETLFDLEISSIFQRRRARRDNDDGNPLIYALKRRKGYQIDHSSVRSLTKNFGQILVKTLAGKAYDFIVPIPSSSKISRILAKRAAKLLPSAVILDCLRKATVGQVLQVLPSPDAIAHRDRTDFTSLLNTLQRARFGDEMEMKVVPSHLRPYVVPIVATRTVVVCTGKKVLLVDDLCSTGASLKAAADLVRAKKPQVVRALCLLSSIR
jgi:hypothetical protein